MNTTFTPETLQRGLTDLTNMTNMTNIPIQFMKGDATCPQGKGIKIIAHIVNNRGGWGKGFVLALSKRSTVPEYRYRVWHHNKVDGLYGTPFELGEVQFADFQSYVWVANMLAQDGYVGGSKKCAVDYKALEQCLWKVCDRALGWKANFPVSVHMPRIGCGLGGKWEMVEPLIVKALCNNGIDVTVYDF